MTVKQLIKKLSKMPEDDKVTLYTSNIYNDGEYEVDIIYGDSGDGRVMLTSNYRKNFAEEEE